ncbi:MAG: polysaccharide export protein [Proteobacteria bacterium]|nr:polysaccharide export protein [Pseudomonadota bacterium]MBU1584863.1 polysaccharide export protein [Pseudomonadota bacterium]MBU2456104.1 polysaccharide export protein [Pseudomonadota bacterium]MBU2628763.1 polysaccharide export protein [Pseudomonadota bacterium]
MKKSFVLIFFFILLTATSGLCQPNGYHVGPRDILSLSIHAGGVEQEKIEVTVSDQGKINVPFIGSVKAQGLTLSDLEDAIRIPLEKDFFISPQINIQVKEYHSISFFISGAVKEPGKYEMTSSTDFLELIAKAGGVLTERGSIAYVLRENHDIDLTNPDSAKESVKEAIKDRETLKIDLTRLLDEGDMTHNIELIPGDIIYIPHSSKLDQAVSKIYVEGQVKKPGVYDFQPGMTAMAACIMAGGFDKYAAISRTKIIRTANGKQEIIKIDLEKVTNGKISDIPIKPGDRIHIPETWL